MAIDKESFGEWLSEQLDEVLHQDQQPNRSAYIVNGITMRQIGECVLRGLIDGGCTDYHTKYNIRTEELDLHHLYHIVYKLKFGDFDPVAVMQNVECHIERVLGIFPNLLDGNFRIKGQADETE